MRFEQEWIKAASIINDWIFYEGHEEEDCRYDNCCEDQNYIREWVIPNENTNIYITLARSDERIDAQVYAPICTVPKEDQKLSLYTDLLSLNAAVLSCCSFGLEEGETIIVIADRGAIDLTLHGLDEMMYNVKRVASEYSKKFISKYNAGQVGLRDGTE